MGNKNGNGNGNGDGTGEELEPVKRLSKDLAKAARTMTVDEARFLVDSYYQWQGNRVTANNQIRSMSDTDEPNTVLQWLAEQADTLESQLKRALDKWTDGSVLGTWGKSITGIGPVLMAGLMANISVELKKKQYNVVNKEGEIHSVHKERPLAQGAVKKLKKESAEEYMIVVAESPERKRIETAGAIWRYAGLDPSMVWEKGQKRPWNASLKRLCWLIGESFTKVSGLESDVYGKLYLHRKEIEVRKNAEKAFAGQAAGMLEKKKFGKDTEAFKHYSAGDLPPAQIQIRSQRWAVKLFLSHYHQVAYFIQFGVLPADPYAFSILGHAHPVPIPNAGLVPGLEEAIESRRVSQSRLVNQDE